MNQTLQITKATAADRPAICNLLQKLNLPTADLPATLADFLVMREHDTVIGTCGLELFGKIGLLRSLAVAPDQQGRGTGNELYQAAAGQAKALGITDLYLITTTAAGFFSKRGFSKVERSAVPGAIRTTAQFSSVCPSSATIMHKQLL